MSAGYAFVSGTGFSYNPSDSKSLISVITASGGLARLTEWGCSMDGVTPTAIPATVDLMKSTQAGAGTQTGTPTIVQIRGNARTVVATCGSKFTAEPTVLTAVKTWYLPEFVGSLVQQYPLNREPESSGLGAYVVKITMSATTGATNARGYMEFEEG